MEPGVRERDTVRGDEEIRVVEAGGRRVQERKLDRPLPELRAGCHDPGLAWRAAAEDAAGG